MQITQAEASTEQELQSAEILTATKPPTETPAPEKIQKVKDELFT